MSQALYSAISGITANQQKLDVVADNIANLNTVGFKASKVNFATIYSRTLSSGSSATASVGGTNPMQVGMGTTISEIGRDFTSGTIQSTGRTSDLNIQGEGFFTILSPNNEILYSRAGNFTLDSNGNLVNPDGLRVLGTANVSGTNGGTAPIRVPQSLNITYADATGTSNAVDVQNSSGSLITTGQVTINGTPINITESSTLDDIITDIDAVSNVDAVLNADGTITVTANGGDITLGDSVNDTSNLLSVLGISSGATIADGDSSASSVLKNTANVTVSAGDDTDDTYTITSYSIGENGAIEATYSNGAKITVTGDPTRELLYETSSGTKITGAAINVTGGAINAAELQLQLAIVNNPKGLISEGGNVFSTSQNVGQITYGIANDGGFGSIDSGSLESSNVDITREFSDMLLAQRCIEASGRIFDVENQVLQKLVQLGR